MGRKPSYMREWRLAAGLTLWEMAERLGSTHATLSRIETGKLPYNQSVLEAYALEFGCRVPDLFGPPPADFAPRARRKTAKA